MPTGTMFLVKTVAWLLAVSFLCFQPAGAVTSDAAPADKYFGRLKYSALRIRFSTQQLKRDLEQHKKLPADTAHMAAFTQDAFFDWARRYPKDHWLASSGFGLAKLFEELPGADARASAIKLLEFVRTTFPKTRYAHSAESELRRGIPILPQPAWAITPSPSPSASGSPSPAGSVSPRPSPTKSP
ncbi:MAG: hypothetical protein NVSMB31_18890 [Vulcanimicrobiaceae bacterium]